MAKQKQLPATIQKINAGYDMLMPQALEVEAALLGTIMIEQNAINEVVDVLKPKHFYSPKYRFVYEAILFLYENSHPIDLFMVLESWRKKSDVFGFSEEKDAAYFLAQLTNKVYTSANIVYYAYIVIEKAMKREIIALTTRINTQAFDESSKITDLVDALQNETAKLTSIIQKKKAQDIGNTLSVSLSEIALRKENYTKGVQFTGIPSGFSALDRITSGWGKTNLIIVAARPGMGKTAFMLSNAYNAAVLFDKKVMIFSLEMSSMQITDRFVSIASKIDSSKIQSGNIRDIEYNQILLNTNSLIKSKIRIDDTPAITITEIKQKSKAMIMDIGLDLIIIDYLQLMTGDAKSENRVQEISTISRAIKALAKELDVPIIALSQLSRAVETRGGEKKPMLSDLRESGSLEQDADQVIFLYRPEYYGLTQDSEGNSTNRMAEVIVAKNRHGKSDTANLQFIAEYMLFCDAAVDFGGYYDNVPAPQQEYPSVKTHFGKGNAAAFEAEKNADNGDGIPF